ncbi:MAG: alkaline phosphatase family protein [Planctomycetota bacterium]
MMRRKRVAAMLILSSSAALAPWALTSCSDRDTKPKVVVIGFDGMDPGLAERLMGEGRLPRLAALRDRGGYRRLGTSIPPQSPVAWSNFITGADPGVHGIFDFVHRDPKGQCRPYYSAADTVAGSEGWEVGDHKIPLTFWPFNHNPTQTLLKRGGVPFWDHLDQAGIPIRIYDIPSNYPPSPSHHGHMCCLSGMGVPDLLGGYGTYQHFSEDAQRLVEEEGGLRKRIVFQNDVAKAALTGPLNTALKTPSRELIEFEIHRHPTEPLARIDLQDQVIPLREGEWSDWAKADFSMRMPPFLPAARVGGICRFYLQQVRPTFRLYVTPLNIDPSDPGEQRISEPPDFVTRISDSLGLFYTAGFQEDHKALSNRVLTDEEYRAQAGYVLRERLNLLGYALDNYDDGFLFFYFSSTDLQAHMFWWEGDGPHPTRTPELARRYHRLIEDLYAEFDDIVGRVLDRVGPDATVMVMSDHGFCNFERQFQLNTWLRDNGYLGPAAATGLLKPVTEGGVDWSKTRAYGMGLNGLYLNLRGRERDGIVDPADRDALLREISAKLLAVRDPQTGEAAVLRVYRSDEVYSGPHAPEAPDLIVGYARGYRASWATTLGDIGREVFSDNDMAWSADHCIAAEEVPGVVFSNRGIVAESPSLTDLAPTILQLFGLQAAPPMKGTSLFQPTTTAAASEKPE